MEYALNLSNDMRVLSATFSEFAPENLVVTDTLPDGNLSDYKFVDGKYIYDPLPEPEPVMDTDSTEDLLLEVAADHEYRLCLLELGVTKNDL